MCIKTKQADNILEKFKVILKGKVFLVRAKELFTWTPTFLDCKESGYYSNNESLQGENLKHVGSQDDLQDLDVDSDVEGVSETVFGDKNSSPNNTFCRHNDKEVEQQSEDPFNLYDLLKQNPKGVALYTISSSHKIYPHCFYPGDNIKKGDEINPGSDKVNLSDSSSSFSHPPGFIPVDLDPCQENIPTGDVHKNGSDKVNSFFGYARVYSNITGGQDNDSQGNRSSIPLINLKNEVLTLRFRFLVRKLGLILSPYDANGLIRFKKKLQDLKKFIRSWVKDKKLQHAGVIHSIKSELIDIDKALDMGNVTDEILFKRMEMVQQLHDAKQMETMDNLQKSKIKWEIKGDENSK
ncbi:hypothetical protein Tco_1139199 [Tanacetum coccineum]